MIHCDYCFKTFVDTINGLLVKTFHETLHKPSEVNHVK